MKTGENGPIPAWGWKWLIPGLGVFLLLLLLLLAALNRSLSVSTAETPSQDLRKRALKTLQAGTESPHPFVRSAAAKASGDSRDPAVLPGLLHAMDDDDPMVRTFAVESAAEFDDEISGIILRRGLEDINLPVRLTAARVLNKYSGPDRGKLLNLVSNDPQPTVRLMTLGSRPKDIQEKYLLSIEKMFGSWGVQEKIVAASALGQTQHPRAIAFLGRLLEDEDPAVRSFSARALGETGSEAGLPFIKKSLRDSSSDVRSESLQAISRFKSIDPKPFLKQGLEDPDEWVRLSAGLGLIPGGGDGFKKNLLEAFASRDYGLRSAAARGLGETVRDNSVKIPEDLFMALIDGNRDPSERVRSASNRALGMTRESRALNPLESALNDPDPSVRCYAAGAILAILSAPFHAAGIENL